jgi:hypothetical protein
VPEYLSWIVYIVEEFMKAETLYLEKQLDTMTKLKKNAKMIGYFIFDIIYPTF